MSKETPYEKKDLYWHRRRHLELVDEDELALMLGLEVKTLSIWRSKKIGPNYTKLGKGVFYRMEDIRKWAEGEVVRLDS